MKKERLDKFLTDLGYFETKSKASAAILAGNVKIGNNVKITANSFVRKDVPDNTLVYGNPAQYKPLVE